MKSYSVSRFLACGTLALVVAATSVCYAQTASSPSDTSDLGARIDALEKQLNDLRTQMEAQKAAATTPAAVPANTVVSATTPSAAPASPNLAGLLGPTTLSGFVDTYYGYNSNQPAGRTTDFRNFDINSGQFGLNMIELVADKSPDAAASRVGYHVALGFGQAENAMNGGELGFDQVLKEGYLEYLAPVGKGLQINFGKFVTPAGAEVIESKDNFNYSRGLLFALAIPYFHYGTSAKYAFNSKFALTGYLVNGWNNSVDNNSGKTAGFSAAWTPTSKFSLTQNYLAGPEQTNDNTHFRHLFDTVVGYNPTAKLSFLANYDYGHDDVQGAAPLTPLTFAPAWWSGFAGYIKYAPNDKWYWAVRGEYYNDHNGFTTGTLGTEDHLSEVTFTLQRMLAGKIMSRLEYRRDMSDNDVFPYRANQFGPIDHQNTITIGMIYAFSSANAK